MSVFASNLLPRLKAPSINSKKSTNHHNGASKIYFQATRNLNLHEYQSKMLMNKFKVNVQNWKLAESPEEAFQRTKELGAKTTVVKAQIHAGGRGKGVFTNGYKGGVKFAETAEQAKEIAQNMLGNRLVTQQTTPEGVLVQKVMLSESLDYEKEFYFAILLDRASGGPVFVASPMGGMDIEHVAATHPEAIFKVPFNINAGPTPAQTAELARKLGFSDKSIPSAQAQFQNLYNLFKSCDATQVEINPMVEVNNQVYCIDAKIGFDDNAQFRQPEIFSFRDTAEEDPREVDASNFNLNYVGMDGNIGCMVNGAGLAMATMDIIKLEGGEPANFLDVGGGATESQVKEAFRIVSSDPKVKAILVNIFGGIVKCDVIAQGIINAARDLSLKHPLIVRLAGTNVDRGYQLLSASGLNITTAADLGDAAKKAVASLHQ